jgi:DNA-binding CsgD family transcriptional regulator
VGLHWISSSLTDNAQAADASLLARAKGVGFDLLDPALETVLRNLVVDRPDLFEAGLDEADVVVSDRPADGSAPSGRVLHLGDGSGRNTVDSLDPSLILSAAALVAAGFSVERHAAPTGVDVPHLSRREMQVARLLTDGASNKVIARALDISVHTAKFHVTGIMEKLGARNRADAVSILLRQGMLVD